jgi:hypothetical protein
VETRPDRDLDQVPVADDLRELKEPTEYDGSL